LAQNSVGFIKNNGLGSFIQRNQARWQKIYGKT
jgi:hypothetical protein